MPSLRKIQPALEPRELALNFGTDDDGEAVIVTLTVQPDEFTVGRSRKIKQAGRTNDVPLFCDALFAVVKDWDITDDDGNVLPLNEDGIDYLRFETALLIAEKMGEALGAPKKET